MVGFYACPEHGAEANDDASYFHFLCRNFGCPSPTVVGRPSLEFLVEGAADFLATQLNCQVLKLRGGTITARRSSGISGSSCGSASMETTPTSSSMLMVRKLRASTGRTITTWRMAQTTLHRTPGKIGEEVVPSFTYGFLPADAQMIRRILEEHGG